MNSTHWKPTASIETLKARARILQKIRQFFLDRDVLEVETPSMSHATVTDPYLHSFPVCAKDKTFYLQTSPEYAMKRLLASGSGSIFQLCKSFRDDEQGRFHNAEFTMLEWYRIGFDHHDLMNEMKDLFKLILGDCKIEKFSYAELFEKYIDINPHTASLEALRKCAEHYLKDRLPNFEINDRDLYMQLLMTEYIESKLSEEELVFIYDYPVTQAALAKIRHDDPPVAERFEVYFKGLELANGFHELSDANEQRKRFEKDLQKRRAEGIAEVPIDENLLAALEHGFPDCAGVALGVDRLIMLALQKSHIEEVIAFPIDRA